MNEGGEEKAPEKVSQAVSPGTGQEAGIGEREGIPKNRIPSQNV
jgi:hypothetical protein